VPTNFKSHTSKRFRDAYDKLPESVQKKARAQYERWRTDPFHPSLHFYCVRDNIWSARVDDNYRALGIMSGDTVTWLWIGAHRGYEERI
jgi:hypothetical protein